MIPTMQPFYQQLNQEEADGLKFCGHGIFLRVILNGAHRLRLSGTPSGKFMKANSAMVKTDSCNYNMHMACNILSLELQYK